MVSDSDSDIVSIMTLMTIINTIIMSHHDTDDNNQHNDNDNNDDNGGDDDDDDDRDGCDDSDHNAETQNACTTHPSCLDRHVPVAGVPLCDIMHSNPLLTAVAWHRQRQMAGLSITALSAASPASCSSCILQGVFVQL